MFLSFQVTHTYIILCTIQVYTTVPACTYSEYVLLCVIIMFCMLTFNFFQRFCSYFALPAVVIDSYPPVTTVEQGESIVLVCRKVGVLRSVTLSYSWTCRDGRTCEGTEVVSGNRLRIGAITNSLHGGTFTCTVTGSGVPVSGTLDLTVTGEIKFIVVPHGLST